MFKSSLTILVAFLLLANCTSYHKGIASYEEVYSANDPSTFEFSHFKYFGSNNVLIINEDRRIKRDLAELCSDFEMSCIRYNLDIESEKATSQMDDILKQIYKYKGETFLLVSDHADITSAIVAKYAKLRYKDQNYEKIFKTFKAENVDALLPLVK
ncbi:MAG: hypothetical protein M9899_08645 [Bdellovibrionaceae bacterium]|nr:hypothetical protein [Pseudobdellovibrionaceae bacterium]